MFMGIIKHSIFAYINVWTCFYFLFIYDFIFLLFDIKICSAVVKGRVPLLSPNGRRLLQLVCTQPATWCESGNIVAVLKKILQILERQQETVATDNLDLDPFVLQQQLGVKWDSKLFQTFVLC